MPTSTKKSLEAAPDVVADVRAKGQAIRRAPRRAASIQTRLLLGFALMLGATVLVGILHRRAVTSLESSARWVEHSQQVHGALDQMMGSLAEAESGQRGYLLTHAEAYLDPYTIALPRVRAHQRELRELVADNPDQRARLDVMDATVAKQLAEMRELIELDRSAGPEAALARLRSDRGLQLMAEVRRQARELGRREEELLAVRRASAEQSRQAGLKLSLWATLGSGILVLLAGTFLSRSITRPLGEVVEGADAIGEGDLGKRLDESSEDELGALARAFNRMAASLSAAQDAASERRRLDAETAELLRALQGHVDVEAFARTALPTVLAAVDGLAGVFFVNQIGTADDVLRRVWTDADQAAVAETITRGEGLHGKAAAAGEALFLDAPHAGSEEAGATLRLRSALVSADPGGLAVLPFVFEGRTLGVLEIATAAPLGEHERALLRAVADAGGLALRTFRAGEETARLLREASDLADELQKQTEELQSLNQEIEEKHRALELQRATLESSELTLREQQDELAALNEELEEQAGHVTARNALLERQNEEIVAARDLVERKVEELRLSAQFKSQFLANVSHELRTPLNSQLILSRLLQENAEGNLTPKQREYLRTIHRSGMELLRLVDDILDLAKIEAGRLEIATDEVELGVVLQEVEEGFRELARAKDLSFVVAAPRAQTPRSLRTDPHRLKQILKNLIGNAIKFTERGEVVVEVGPGPEQADPATRSVVFHVRDTGIGLSDDQRDHIFEAFRQGDGSTSRTYGGTGLGLTISRELASLLGGEIHVESTLGQGSVFSLVIADAPGAAPASLPVASAVPFKGPTPVMGGRKRRVREATLPGAIREAVVVTNDEELATAIAGSAEDSGFSLVRVPYDPQALLALRQRVPSAVVLAPDGGDMETASLLRAELEERKLPVHFVASLDEPRRAGAEIALFFHRAEAQRTLGRRGTDKDVVLAGRSLLLVDDDMRNVFALTAVLEREGLAVTFAEDGEAALRVLDGAPNIDVILMDLMMPKMDGLTTIRRLREDPRFAQTPIIALTAKAMQGDREKCLEAGASDYITKPLNVDQLLSLLRVWLYPKPTTQQT